VALIELEHAWRRFPPIDPGLPSGLLPARRSGSRAAKLFAAKLSPAAAPGRRCFCEWVRLATGATVGLGTVEAAKRVHGVDAAPGSPAMVLVVWTDEGNQRSHCRAH
jgi:DNA-binding transcriptional regulator PaaX